MIRVLSILLLLLATGIGAFAQEEGYAQSDGVKIYYQTFGKGKPLLLINGGPGFPSTNFDYLAHKLAEKRKVIIFDQRGTGKSKLPYLNRGSVNMSLMVDDIESLRQHLKIKKWDVYGHSFGGVLAMFYAKEHENRIDRLILSSSGGIDIDFIGPMPANIQSRLSAEDIVKLGKLNQEFEAEKDNVDIHNRRFKVIAHAYVYWKNNIPFAQEMLTKGNVFVHRVNSLVWMSLRKGPYDLKPDLADFARETLIIHGRQDVIGESVPLEIHAVLPNSRLEWINQASHYLWLDQPDIYFNLIDEFLN